MYKSFHDVMVDYKKETFNSSPYGERKEQLLRKAINMAENEKQLEIIKLELDHINFDYFTILYLKDMFQKRKTELYFGKKVLV